MRQLFLTFALLMPTLAFGQSHQGPNPPFVATGSTTPRTPMDRAADWSNVLDFGADATGASDATTKVQAAANLGKGVFAPRGTWLLSSPPTSANNVPWFMIAPNITGGGFPAANADGSQLQGNSGLVMMLYQSQTGNQNTLAVQANVPATGATAGYQKNAISGIIRTSDPSGAFTFDSVGVFGSCNVYGGITTGRCWGGNLAASVTAGSDGALTGLELDIYNNGAAQSALNTTTSKTALSLIAMGAADTTAGMVVASSGGRKFYDGIVFESPSLGSTAWRLWTGSADLAHLDASGNLLATTVGSVTGALPLTTPGGTQAQVLNAASAVNSLTLQGSATGSAVTLGAAGTDTNVGIVINPKGSGTIQLGGSSVAASNSFFATAINASNGSFISGTSTLNLKTPSGTQAQISDTASAVDYVTMTGAAAGGSVTIGSGGTDTNVGINISPRGSGTVQLGGGSVSTSNTLYVPQAIVSGFNSLTLNKGGSTGIAPSLSATGSDTNVSMQYKTQGTGSHIFQVGGSTVATITSAGLQLPQTTVASLPTCNTGAKGALYGVTDATAPTYNGTLTGGGAVAIPVYCNGSAWTAH